MRTDKKKRRDADRKIYIIFAAALAAMFIISLCFRTAEPGFIPAQAAANLWSALKIGLAELFNRPLALDKFDIIEKHEFYYESVSRLKESLVTCIAGMAVCAGGAAFQTMFRNPLASPNILGISTGVNLGTAMFIMLFPTTAMGMLTRRYIYCYACAAVMVGITILSGRLAGRRLGRFSVQDMLVVGAIVSQFGNVLAMYFQFKIEEADSTLLTSYQELSMGIYVMTDLKSILIFLISMAASILPLYMLRYRMNASVLDDPEARSMGVRPDMLRTAGMVCGAVMSVTALVECGDMGIMSMAVPPVVRYLMKGADFRKVLYISMCVGGTIMLFARSVCSMIYVAGMALPINFAVSLIVLPLFVAALSKTRSVYA
ncbi:MAG: iron ABC transporter permease [Anaerovoracaceae bacterium]|nr:iron ABC transporter permease [Bacillota bacterium]MDY2670223.1 iron ABC transporter permease [Anaerovoracaceae bacterium]